MISRRVIKIIACMFQVYEGYIPNKTSLIWTASYRSGSNQWERWSVTSTGAKILITFEPGPGDSSQHTGFLIVAITETCKFLYQ